MADVQELIAKAGFIGPVPDATRRKFERFAELVRAEERERCARIVERRAEERFDEHGTREHDTNACYYTGLNADEYETRDMEDEDCAAAIREGK